jgi:hypothetical protein
MRAQFITNTQLPRDPDMVHAGDGIHPEGMYRVGALMAGYDWAVQEQKNPFFSFQLTPLLTEAMHTYVVNLPQSWLQRIGSQAEPPSSFH